MTGSDGAAMKGVPQIAVVAKEGERLNGLGMMMLQYLEQNFSDFREKQEAGRRIQGCMSVEVEKGIGVTLDFQGDRIVIENGVREEPDLHLRSSYLLLSRVLSGKANPYLEVLRGNVRLLAFPKRPVQSLKVLRFLKIPEELLLEAKSSRRRAYLVWAFGSVLGIAGLALLVHSFLQLLGGE